jgi:hypothetical protein
MKLPYKKSQVLKTITIDGINVIEAGDLLSIYKLLEENKITRLMAWQIVRMVHENKIKCPLSIYGTLTVYSLSKDLKQFKKLYSQGCSLLQDNNVVNIEEDFAVDIENNDVANQIIDALKSGKFTIKMKDNGEINNNFPNTDRFKGLN